MPKDTVVMAFSLSSRAAAYVRGAGQGRKSALVDRCILYYKDNRVQELLDQIAFMEGNIQGLQSKLFSEEKLDEISGASKIPDDKAKKVPPSRGLKRFFKFLRP